MCGGGGGGGGGSGGVGGVVGGMFTFIAIKRASKREKFNFTIEPSLLCKTLHAL